MGGAPSKQEFRTAILDLVNSNQVRRAKITPRSIKYPSYSGLVLRVTGHCVFSYFGTYFGTQKTRHHGIKHQLCGTG